MKREFDKMRHVAAKHTACRMRAPEGAAKGVHKYIPQEQRKVQHMYVNCTIAGGDTHDSVTYV